MNYNQTKCLNSSLHQNYPYMGERDNMQSDSIQDLPNIPPNLDPSGGDVSKNAILVLLVLTLFVSAFGTWVVLKATENVGVAPTTVQAAPKTTGTGEIRVDIIRPEDKKGPAKGSATGLITLSIINPEEK